MAYKRSGNIKDDTTIYKDKWDCQWGHLVRLLKALWRRVLAALEGGNQIEVSD